MREVRRDWTDGSSFQEDYGNSNNHCLQPCWAKKNPKASLKRFYKTSPGLILILNFNIILNYIAESVPMTLRNRCSFRQHCLYGYWTKWRRGMRTGTVKPRLMGGSKAKGACFSNRERVACFNYRSTVGASQLQLLEGEGETASFSSRQWALSFSFFFFFCV